MDNSIIKKILVCVPLLLTSVGIVESAHNLPLNNVAVADSAKEFTKLSEANRWGNKLINQAHYSTNDKIAIYKYTKNSSILNAPLREVKGDINKLPNDMQDDIRKLDYAISKSTIPESIIVHRLLNLDYLQSINGFSSEDLEKLYRTENGKYNKELVSKLNNVMNGGTFHEYGYTSTQLVKGAALVGRPIELKLELSKGATAAYVDANDLTAYRGQQEIILPRNIEYTVNKVKLSPDEKRIVIDAIAFKK